jgi:membrane-associated phospholipid phosphatase
MGLLATLDSWDKAASHKIHTLEMPTFLEAILYCFAKIFNGEGNLLVIALVCIFMPSWDIEYAHIVCLAKYMQILGGSAICISLLKNLLARPRPPLNEEVRRISYMRKHEFNASMPSGDSAQAGVLAGFIFFFFPHSTLAYYVWILPPFSMFGRVYFQCHWICDTIVGASYGFLFVYLNLLMEVAIMGERFDMG